MLHANDLLPTLGQAPNGAAASFAFDAWLLDALRQGWRASVQAQGADADLPPACDRPPPDAIPCSA